MAKRDYAKLEIEREKIHNHFKNEKKKVWVIFIISEIILLVAAWVLTGLLAGQQQIAWFVISLFFTLVFPITQFSNKMKKLTAQEKEQLGFAEQDY